MANLIYPTRFPIPGKLDDNNKDQPTGFIDYIQIQRAEEKKGSAKSNGFFYNTGQVGGSDGGLKNRADVVYLPIPQNLNVNYMAGYNNVSFGAAGVAAGQALAGGMTSEAATAAIQDYAGKAMPDVALSALAGVIQALPGGGASGVDKNALLAVSQGKIFNPYTENIFTGTDFRSHTFQFKLVARNDKEAQVIGKIIAYLKQGMLPDFSEGTASAGAPAGGSGGGGSTADAALGKTNIQGRYLTVPDKFKLKFMRLKEDGTKLIELPHYLFNICVLKSLDVTYTPDGNYVSMKKATATTNILKVPAISLTLSFAEVAYTTAAQAGSGY